MEASNHAPRPSNHHLLAKNPAKCDPVADELCEMQLGRVFSCEYRPQFQAVLSPVAESFRAKPQRPDGAARAS